MEYPVKNTDLAGEIADNDYIATLIVAEAIVTNSLDSLEFTTGVDKANCVYELQNWSGFEEIKNTINSQKKLLNHFDTHQPHPEISIDLVNNISKQVSNRINADLKKVNKISLYYKLSVAACTLFIVLGISFSFIKTENNTTKTASETSAKSNPQNNSIEKTNGGAQYSDSIAQDRSETESTSKKIASNDLASTSNENSNRPLYIGFFAVAGIFIAISFVLWRRKTTLFKTQI